MSNRLINISVNLSKIPQNKKIKGRNSGDEYVSLDVTIKDEPDQWGKDCSVAIAQTKDERSNKIPKVFCGNGKKLFGFGSQSQQPDTSAHGSGKPNGYQPQPNDSEPPF